MAVSNADLFRKALAERIRTAELVGRTSVQIRAGDLHEDVMKGRKPPNIRNCCRIMVEAMGANDKVLPGGPPKGEGHRLTVVYSLPRST